MAILLISVFGYLALRPDIAPEHPAAPAINRPDPHSAPTEQVRPGWWESRRAIYYNIPARVLFREPENGHSPDALAQIAWAEFERVGKIFNPSDPGSEISRLNTADTDAQIPVSAGMFDALKISRTLWEASDGAFDPTMLPIKQIWREAVRTQTVPTNRTITDVLSRVGFGRVRLIDEKTAVELGDTRIRFDFGGVAKGYAVDRVAGLLQEHGITAGLVQLGGEIAAFGANDAKPWRIGIQHPTAMDRAWGVLAARDSIRVSTSGNYQQPLIITGHRFYHIFSPHTGKPVSEKILGVTTASTDGRATSALLDGAATAITVLGVESGLRLAEHLGIEALIIKETGNGRMAEQMTAGFNRLLKDSAPGADAGDNSHPH